MSSQRTTNPISSLVCEIKFINIDQPTTQPICIFVQVILQHVHRAYYKHEFDVTSRVYVHY